MNAFGKTNTVLPQQVLVVRPKEGVSVDQAASDMARSKVQTALKSIPVDSCKKTKNGGLVVKFPSKECKQKAGTAVKGCFEQDPKFQVSEPRS